MAMTIVMAAHICDDLLMTTAMAAHIRDDLHMAMITAGHHLTFLIYT
jgi:hypothetical protein